MKNIFFYMISLLGLLYCRGHSNKHDSFNLLGLHKNENLTDFAHVVTGDSNAVLSPETIHFRNYLLRKFARPALGFSRFWARFISRQGPELMVANVIPQSPPIANSRAPTECAGPAIMSNSATAENRAQPHNGIFAIAMNSPTPLSAARTTVIHKLRQNVLSNRATDSKAQPHGVFPMVGRRKPVRREARTSTTNNKLPEKPISSATPNVSNYATRSQPLPAHAAFAETLNSIASSEHPPADFLAADNPFTDSSNANQNYYTDEHDNAFNVLFCRIIHCSKNVQYFIYITASVSSTIIVILLGYKPFCS